MSDNPKTNRLAAVVPATHAAALERLAAGRESTAAPKAAMVEAPRPELLIDGGSGLVLRWRVMGAFCAARDAKPGRRRRSQAADAVLWAILDRMGSKGQAWPSVTRVAIDANVDRRTAGREIARLVRGGWLRCIPGGPGRSNRYAIGPTALLLGEPADPGVWAPADPGADGAPMGVDTHRVWAAMPTRVWASAPIESALRESAQEPAPPSAAVGALPGWLPMEAWTTFVQMRREARRPVTKAVASKLVAELNRLRREGHDPAEVLDQSTRNGWIGLFPIKSAHPAPRDDGAPPRRQEFKTK